MSKITIFIPPLPQKSYAYRRGDAQIIHDDEKNAIVIDGGEDALCNEIIKYCKSHGITHITYILSHWHYDHDRGMKLLLDSSIIVDKIYCPPPSDLTKLRDSDARDDYSRASQRIAQAKNLKKTIIYPPADQNTRIKVGAIVCDIWRRSVKPSENVDYQVNNTSLVCYFPELYYMTSGDTINAINSYLANKYGTIRVFKIPHHGNACTTEATNRLAELGAKLCWYNHAEAYGVGIGGDSFSHWGALYCKNKGFVCLRPFYTITMTAADGKLYVEQNGSKWTYDIPYNGKPAACGWLKGTKGMWYQYPDGTWPTGWAWLKTQDGKSEAWHYFDADGWMLTGWRELQWSQSKKKNKKDWFFFDQKTGVMLTGWQVLLWSGGVSTFCFDENGVMLTGWHWLTKDGKTGWYYFENSGAMHTGWIFDDGAWYYLGADGKMVTGWVTYKGKKCYLEPKSDRTHVQGQCYVSRTAVIDGKSYKFDKDGYAEEIAVGGSGKAELNGCDVASYQAGIDFAKMTTTDFAIIKGTQGTWYVNPYADIQYSGAEAAGKLLGMYHYAEGKDPTAEAQYFIKKVGSRVGSCILALDWEGHDNSKFNSDAEVAWVLKFAMEVYRLTKVHIILYMSKSVTRRRNWAEVAKDVRLWCAQYANQEHTDYKSNPWTDNGGFGAWKSDTIRQYSSKGRVTGYGKDLDINRAYMSKAEWLAAAAGKNTVVAEKPKTQWSAYVSMTTNPVKISNSGSDENGNYKNGKAGDQTGKEWRIRDWYNYPWNCVLRHPLAEVRACLATMAVKAAENDNIGYDQLQRDDYGIELAKNDYDPSKIKKPVESDCSKGVIDNTKGTGHTLGIPELQNIKATYTGNMRAAYKAAGFYVLTESKYLTSSDYLLAGDILLNDKHHTCTVITNGSKSGDTIVMPLVKKGSTGAAVEQLQEMLIAQGYSCGKWGADGDFGNDTLQAVKSYQRDHGLEVDGEVGPITWAALIEGSK